MKNFVIPMSLAVIVMASCSVNENQTPLVEGTHLTLTGESYTATKVSIGEKDGDTYPLLWFTGDAININSTNGTIVGEIAELYSESSGKASGVFQTVNTLVPDSAMDLIILYPGYSLEYDFESGVISGTVSETQTQRSSGSSIHVGTSAFAYAETAIEAGQTDEVTFSLNQKTAFVKINVTSSTYSSCTLTSVKLSATGAELSGNVSYDINTKEMTVTNANESVGVTISNPSSLSSSQTVYFTSLPFDLTKCETTMIVATMASDEGNVTVPVLITGKELVESHLSVIDVNLDDGGSYAWYDPVEVRDLVNGWAYGEQNTFYIEQYENESNSITFSVKARGDFSKVKEPKYYGLITGSSDATDVRLCYLPDGTNTYETQPTHTVSDNYEITVYCYSQSEGTGRWAVVAIYDENYNILWSYMICKYLSGDEPSPLTTVNGYVLLDRPLGLPYSMSLAAEKKDYNGPGALFQWGRKDPFPRDQVGLYDMVAVPDDSDISTAISHPYYAYKPSGTVTTDWQASGNRSDLWGGENNTADWYDPNSAGHKTIYDPCPEGYRVCDANVLNEVKENYEKWEFKLNRTDQLDVLA